MLKKVLIILVVFVIGGFGLIQLVPYGRNHTNPPVISEPEWANAETLALARQACFDCHSNETVWPWYSSVAPVSWLTQHDVDEGREYVNFSEWRSQPNHSGEEGEELAEVVLEGEMPPAVYLLTHPEARLTAAEKQTLAQGLWQTAGGSGSFSSENEREHEEDD